MDKRRIFVLSPGRCGTGYLALLLRTVPGVAAFHEPEPRFSDVNEVAQFNHEAARLFWLERKAPAIENALNGADVYAETSHLFVNAWGKVPAALGLDVDVIALTRPARDVALSYWRRTSIPGRTRTGKEYLIHPNSPHNALKPRDWKRWHSYQLCYWHALEVGERVKHLETLYAIRKARVCEMTLGELATQDGFNRLVLEMGLGEPDWRQWQAASGRVVNPNPPAYANRWPGRDLGEMEREVEAWIR